MEKQVELSEIALIPAEINNGYLPGKYNFGIQDEADKSMSLPIFTSPMDSVVSGKNWEMYYQNGIRPVIPRTEPLSDRFQACQYVFAAFSLGEVREKFIATNQRGISAQFKICLDSGNGHDVEVFNVGRELKRIYGPQVIMMAGNIGNPKTYVEYCKVGFDYVRVGMATGSLVDESKFGFYQPLAQLLIDITGTKGVSCVGLKPTKIIADGGIKSHADILKAIALGADYVMIGREFAKVLEASGEIYRKDGDKRIPVENLPGLLSSDTRPDLWRKYCGNTTLETQALRGGYDEIHDWLLSKPRQKPFDSRCDWVKVDKTMAEWTSQMYEVFSYGFTLAGAVDWKTFKNNIKYART